MKKKIVILLVLLIPILSGCSQKSWVTVCGKRVIEQVSMECKGVEGCMVQLKLEDGSIFVGKHYDFHINENGQICFTNWQ